MDVRSFTVGPVQENCYLVRRDGSDRAVIVDPGEEPDRLLNVIERLGVKLDAILLTHTHFDHIGAVAPVAKATGAPVYCPELETFILRDIMPTSRGRASGRTSPTRPTTPSRAASASSWPAWRSTCCSRRATRPAT